MITLLLAEKKKKIYTVYHCSFHVCQLYVCVCVCVCECE